MTDAKNIKTTGGADIGLDTDPVNLLKFQALALSNRLNSYKKNYNDLKQNCNKLETTNLALKELLLCFKGSWLKFIEEVTFTHNQLQINENDECGRKFNSATQNLNELLTLSINSEPSRDSQNKSKEILDTFFTTMGSVYSSIRTNYDQGLTEWKKFLENPTANQLDDKLIQENKEIKQKLAQSESQIMNLGSLLSENTQKKPSTSEYERTKERLRSLEENLEDALEQNENVNRRIRYIVKNKMTWKDGLLDLGDEDTQEELKHGCTCGGKFFEQLFSGITDLPKILQPNIVPEQNPAQHEIASENADKLSAMNEEKRKEDEKNRQSEYLSLTEKVQQLEKQIEELLASKVKLSEEVARYKIDSENIDERVFNSKLFNSLVNQAQEVLRMCTYLKGRVQNASTTIEEYDEQRRTELYRLTNEFSLDRGDLSEIIERLKQSLDIANARITQKENELLQEYELNAKSNNIMKILEENDRRYENLNKENVLLRNECKELKQRLEGAQHQLEDSETKNSELNAQNFSMKQQLPNFSWDSTVFRHQKHKEFLLELHEINKKYQLGIKEKVDDMRHYIKSREEKIEVLEKKIKSSNVEVDKERKQSAQLIQEVELNSKISEDIMFKSSQLNSQITTQNENFSKLVKDRHIEKSNFESEKISLSNKLKLKDEEISQLKKLIEDLREKCGQQEGFNRALEETVAFQKSLLHQNKTIREDLLRKIEELKIQIGLEKERGESLQKATNQKTKELEENKLKLMEKQDFIDKKLARAKDLAKDTNIDLTAEDIDFLKLEVKRYRRILMCTVCGSNEKSVVLTKCFHTFCKKCIDMNLQVRDRKCPTCRTKFGTDNVEKLWID